VHEIAIYQLATDKLLPWSCLSLLTSFGLADDAADAPLTFSTVVLMSVVFSTPARDH